MKIFYLCCVSIVLATALSGQALTGQSRFAPGDTILPLSPARTISFTTDEGTEMTLDVSPDGKRIVFSLLGDLYSLPITGGTATRLTSGMAMDKNPAFSPDGRQIVFASDGSGTEQLWLANADGSSPRRLTRGLEPPRTFWQKTYILLDPSWSPDGKTILVARHKGLWKVDVATGYGEWLLDEATRGSSIGGGSFSADGRQVYITQKSGLSVYDIQSRKIMPLRAFRWGWRPVASRDGQWVVYEGCDEDKPQCGQLKFHRIQRDNTPPNTSHNQSDIPISNQLLGEWLYSPVSRLYT